MLEFLNSLTWPGVVALLGSVITSVITIVIGLLGYMRSSKADPQAIQHSDYEKLHSRINHSVERVAVAEGDIKEIRSLIRSLQKQIADHEQRDIEDFKLVDAKIDRLMDIVVRILQDDRL